MGLLDDVLGMAGLSGGASAQPQQDAGVLSMLLNYINSPQVGGIGGLQQMFQQKGLGGIVSSWISTGQNLPISADQLQNVLHGNALQDIAAKSGMGVEQLTSMISQCLPNVVDNLTLHALLPAGDALQKMMKG